MAIPPPASPDAPVLDGFGFVVPAPHIRFFKAYRQRRRRMRQQRERQWDDALADMPGSQARETLDH